MKRFTLIIGMLALGTFVFGQRTEQLQHRLSKITDEQMNVEQSATRGTTDAGDIIFHEKFDSTLWHTASNDGVAVPANMPNGWTVYDATGNNFFWRWSTTGPRGRYTSNPWNTPNRRMVIKSSSDTDPEGEKGFMMMELDFFNTTSEGQDVEPSVEMDSYVQTRAIETTGNPHIVLSFEQYHRFCCKQYDNDNGPKVFVSNDNINWTRYDVHSAAVNAFPKNNPSIKEIFISSVAGNQAQVYVRFHVKGMVAYFWIIDDVKLLVPQEFDVRLKGYWADYNEGQVLNYTHSLFHKGFVAVPFHTPYYASRPFITSRSLVQNFGYSTFDNVIMNTKIVRGSNDEVLNEKTSAPRNITSEQIDSLEAAHNYRIPQEAASMGAYYISGLLSGTQTDQMPENNTYRYDFNITENVMGYANPEHAQTERCSPYNWVGSADGDAVGALYVFNTPMDVIPGTSDPAWYVARGVNIVIPRDGYNLQLWRSGNVAYLKAELYQGVKGPQGYTFDFSSPNVTTEQKAIDSTMANTWVYLPFIADGASENFTPEEDGHEYLLIVRFQTNGERFYVGADEKTQPSFYSLLNVLNNRLGITGSDCSMSMELVADRVSSDPVGTARIRVMIKHHETGVVSPAKGATVEFRTQDENGQSTTQDYTTDNDGYVEIPNLKSRTYATLAYVMDAVTNERVSKRADVTVLGSGVYTREVTLEPKNATGISANDILNSVRLYPIPSSNTVTIEAPVTLSRIVVSNIMGQVVDVINTPSQTTTLSVEDYTTGVYMVTLYDNNGNVATHRLIKQ